MNNTYKYVTNYMLKWSFIATILGLAGGFTAYILKKSIVIVENTSNDIPIWIAPIVAGVILCILYLFDKNASGFGTDLYLGTVNSDSKKFSIKTFFTKIIATATTLGLKGSGGVEGPMLVIGGSLSSAITKIPFLKNKITKDDVRLILICGAAGAIGAIFKSPLGGGIFVVEILYRTSLHYSDLFPAMLSSTMGYVTISKLTDSSPLFTVPSYIPDVMNVPLFILAGILAGVISIIFMYIFKRIRILFAKIPFKQIHPIIGGILTGIVLLGIPQVSGTGTNLIQEMIENNIAIRFLLILLVGKMIATSFTVASGGSAGLVIPALFIGAISGNILLEIVNDGDLGLSASLVIAGMAASLASITNAPIAAAVMIIEMDGLPLGVPAIIGSIVGYTIAHSHTIYDNVCPDSNEFRQVKSWRSFDINNKDH